MKENEISDPHEKTNHDHQVDLFQKEITVRKQPEKLTLKSILNYLYSNSGRTAVTFGLGVLVGIILFAAFFSNSFKSTESISGTMGGLDNYENFEVADYLQISTPSADGNIAIQYREQMVIAQVNLNSPQNVKLMLSFNPDNLTVYSVKPVKMNDESSINSGRSFITLNNKGNSRYLILFRNSINKDLINVKLISDGGHVENFSVRTRAN